MSMLRHNGHLSSGSTNEHPDGICMLNIQLYIVDRWEASKRSNRVLIKPS